MLVEMTLEPKLDKPHVLEDRRLKCPECSTKMVLKSRGPFGFGKPIIVCPKCGYRKVVE
jgi:DNA-directed RNA polymerase subunit RPC12/RpoP